jgi:hypothetical protein
VAEWRDWQRIGIITRLGTAQTLAWASSYYLPAMLADPIARDLGVSAAHVFAAFSPRCCSPRWWGRASGGL